jgi:hypothetical protein
MPQCHATERDVSCDVVAPALIQPGIDLSLVVKCALPEYGKIRKIRAINGLLNP